MKTNFPLILKNAWPYGLILAGISIVLSVLFYIFNVNMFSITFAILSFLIFVISHPRPYTVSVGYMITPPFLRQSVMIFRCLSPGLSGCTFNNMYSYTLTHHFKIFKKKGKPLISHRSTNLPLLPSEPGGV